jgi:uncharacterized protein YfkK (UPF0435 family)
VKPSQYRVTNALQSITIWGPNSHAYKDAYNFLRQYYSAEEVERMTTQYIDSQNKKDSDDGIAQALSERIEELVGEIVNMKTSIGIQADMIVELREKFNLYNQEVMAALKSSDEMVEQMLKMISALEQKSFGGDTISSGDE